MSDEQDDTYAPIYRLIAEATQEFTIVTSILEQLSDLAPEEHSVWAAISQNLSALTAAAVLLSGHDRAWLEQQHQSAVERMKTIGANVRGQGVP